ncbi:MAG: hypothetical protein SF123_07135 [Chloroflexota bacterium]|nr:hypothetical protein [Chloroflexota bacterium]
MKSYAFKFVRIGFLCFMAVPLIFAKAQADVSTFWDSPANVEAIAWSPDGTLIALAGGGTPCEPQGQANYDIRIYDTTSGLLMQRLVGHTCIVTSLAWSPDGTRLVSTSMDAQVKVWAVQTSTLLFSQPTRSMSGWAVSWSPDGSRIAVSPLYSYIISVIDARTGERIAELGGGDFWDIGWSQDGTKLFATTSEAEIKIFDVNASSDLITLSLQTAQIADAEWSPDGELLAASTVEGMIYVWSTQDWSVENTITTVNSSISEIEWGVDNDELLIVDGQENIRSVNRVTGNSNLILPSREIILTLTRSPYGGRIAYGISVPPEVDISNLQLGANEDIIEQGAFTIVPNPSPERLQAITDACGLQPAADQALTAQISTQDYAGFTTQLEALPETALPPGCRADLLAVAAALSAQGE